jgi:spore coat polysaccharide biosynthesis predicted glycosyltransferase SpsG
MTTSFIESPLRWMAESQALEEHSGVGIMAPPGLAVHPLRVVLRADAGPEIGYGHLIRTLALGEALKELADADCLWVTRPPQDGFVLPVPSRRFELPAEVAVEREAPAIAGLGPTDWLVADLYQLTEARLRTLSGPWGLAVIDDEPKFTFSCDLLVCPNVELSMRTPRADMPGRAILTGAEHILLRAPFSSGPGPQIANALGRVLICFGGGEHRVLLRRVLSWLREVLPPSVERVRVVTSDAVALEGAAGRDAHSLRIECLSALDAETMAQELRSADVAVLGGGTVLYEAAALGVPAIWVTINDAQAREAEAFARLGAGLHLGTADRLTKDALASAFSRLVPAAARAAVSCSAQTVIDGRGCARVAERIVQLHEARSRSGPRPGAER